jgi:hypothetical protein
VADRCTFVLVPISLPCTLVLHCLQAYSGDALATKLAAVPIDRAAVESAMASVLPSTTESAPVEAGATNLAWIAGPIVGGVAFFVLLGAGYWWLRQRRAAQATQGKDQYMDTMAEARTSLDGATPREGGSASGLPRAQASLN